MSDIEVLAQDDCLLVLLKPPGLLSVPGRGAEKQDCLSRRVQAKYPEALVVHRLDMGTSGLMLMARSVSVQKALNRAFAERQVLKRYVAVVRGRPQRGQQDWSSIELPIAVDWPRRPLRIIDAQLGKPSQTLWRFHPGFPENTDPTTSRLELEPVTGRSHQLRVHLQAIGHPIVGDPLYGEENESSKASRLMLHACEISLTHPGTGKAVQWRHNAVF